MEIDHYSHSAFVRERLEEREEIVLRKMAGVESQARILDLGCGDGCFLAGVHKKYPQLKITGIDLSLVQLEKAKKRIPSGEFSQATLSKGLPYPDNHFDVIYCGEVIEHLFDPDSLLKEAHRVLRPGGVLYMTTPNLFAWYNRVLMLFGISPLFVEYSTEDASVGYGILRRVKSSDQPVGHLRIFHPLAFRELQEKCGFKNVELNAAAFEVFPSMIKIIDQLIARIWIRGGSILISKAEK